MVPTLVEIEVDTDTGEIHVNRIASAFDAGKIINEQNCRGQVVGGVIQGQGSALNEGYIFHEGRLLNNSFVDYAIPTAKDIPDEMQQFFIETPHPQGPLGARGVAEHPMISVPSAIGNALSAATQLESFDLPAHPRTGLHAAQTRRLSARRLGHRPSQRVAALRARRNLRALKA